MILRNSNGMSTLVTTRTVWVRVPPICALPPVAHSNIEVLQLAEGLLWKQEGASSTLAFYTDGDLGRLKRF